MHATQLLHNFFKKSCPKIHTTRLASLQRSVQSLLDGRRLSLTGLGRSNLGPGTVKNKIKQVDRLLGNKHLHKELIDFYKQLAYRLIGNKLHPIILVDWASVDNRDKFHVLKASIAYEGRSITVYDHVEYKDRPRKQCNNSHDQFIENLCEILPKGCQPIIVTDAAFVARWFKRIEDKGWYWVGRVRGFVTMRRTEDKNWETCQMIFKKATSTPETLGEYVLTKKNSLQCQLYLYKNPAQGRKRKNRDGSLKKHSDHQDHARAAKEPWLLASNLPKSFNCAKKIVKIYKKRMQIEEVFRDLKDPRYGLSAREILSHSKERVAVLLLIAAIALFIFVMLGRAAYDSGDYKNFQANTITNRRVLSFGYLGKQIYEHFGGRISLTFQKTIIAKLLEEIPTYDIL